MKRRLCDFGGSALCALIIFLLASLCAASPGLAALAAQFAGIGPDVVSEVVLTPDNKPDFNIKVTGLRSVPTSIKILSDTGGIWHVPFNGVNWVIALTNYSNGNGNLHFSQFTSNKFSLQVTYADGSTDQADVTSPPSPSSLRADFLGVGPDVVSEHSPSPDTRPDFNIQVSGLRSVPVEMQILSDTNGVWKMPYNGFNWVIGLNNYNNGSGNLHFSRYNSNTFKLQVRYSDGSIDQTDVTNQAPPPPSTLKANFQGIGPDLVNEHVLTPDGRPDFNIQVSGLRSVPVEMQILSDTNGIWKMPYNGTNWVIALTNYSSGNGNLHFSRFNSNTFKLQVAYADGTTDQTDVTSPTTNNAADVQRFLEQATFGPTPALTAQVQASGIEQYIDQQRNAPMQDYPNLEFWPTTRPATCVDACQRDNYTFYQVQKHFFTNALTGQDQLRQRVAFGLSQILVTSQVDVPYPAWMRSYQQLLYRSAFGNFRQLLYDVTLHPTMGRFLDMLNNPCQRTNPINVNVCRSGGLSQPNENYAREILQLFSIGTFELNDNGTRKLNNGNPIPTYDQKIIEEFSRVFTGWILAPALPSADPNAAAGSTVPNYRDPMVQRLDSQNREAYHDRGSKVLLRGVTLAAGRTSSQDLNDAIDNIAYHPNVAPYMSKLLIQQLVTSNPSPDYVARIVAVWRANQTSPTQLFQVVKAILLDDQEARGGNRDAASTPNYGKLREPILFETAILRALNATSDGVLNNIGGGIGTADMGEDLFNAASVFNYFPPTARVAGESAVGPEFAIFSSLSSLRRANWVNQIVYSSIAPAPPNRPVGTSVDLTGFNSLAANPDQLVDALNNLLLHGSMSTEMRNNIRIAVAALPATNALARVRSAVYLILTSSQFQVQR